MPMAPNEDERYPGWLSLTYQDWFAHFMLWLWWYAST